MEDASYSNEAKAKKIQELKGLMARQPIGHRRGPIEGKILKLLVYGDQQIPENQIRIGEIRKSLTEFAHRRKEGVFADEWHKQEGPNMLSTT